MLEKTQGTEELKKGAEMLKAIAHPMRLAIVNLLENKGRLSVTDIYNQLGIEQAVASHHLSILKSHSVVDSQREGKSCFYYLKHRKIGKILDCIRELAGKE